MAGPGRGRWQQPVVFVLHHLVTLAGVAFKTRTVQHRDAAACVANQAEPLQSEGCFGDSHTANTEHVGDQLLGHRQLVAGQFAVVGFEGVVGISILMGGGSTPSRAVVQSAGKGYRLRAGAMKGEFDRSGPVMNLMLRFIQALITQMSQTAVCNRHHTLDQQLCRWLLLSLDRMHGDQLVMTQELISNMLGVRREGVTEAALKLQKAELIDYARGHITVRDRHGLQKRTCECYDVVKKEYDRLLPDIKAI